MPKIRPIVSLLAIVAFLNSCSAENAVAPDQEPQPQPQPSPSVPLISGVVISATAYTTLVGSTITLTAKVDAAPGATYSVQWTLPETTNTAEINIATGELTALKPGFAFPIVCVDAILNGAGQTVCKETSIRIVSSFASVENRNFAFVRNKTIFVASANGSEPYPLIPNADQPSWSPDGQRIAFTDYENYQLAPWRLCIANHDGSGIRCATGAGNGRVLGKPSWSPDGSTIAFSTFTHSCPGGNCGQLGGYFSGVLLLNTATMQVQSVNSLQVTSTAWSPDGRKIAITLFGAGTFGRGALATVNADGSGLKMLAGSLGTYSVNAATWSPDARKLALTLSDENACPWYCDSAIGIVDVDAMQLKVLDRAHTCSSVGCPAGEEAYITDAPQWVDNGARLAYTLTNSECYRSSVPCTGDIMIARVDDGKIEVLLASATSPSWRQ